MPNYQHITYVTNYQPQEPAIQHFVKKLTYWNKKA